MGTNKVEENHDGVTEVFVTKVSPQKIENFLQWSEKLHKKEAKAKGFRRVFVQPPKSNEEGSWITFLQFDTQENLDNWLNSDERKEILNDLSENVQSLESHRVQSSFAGWFKENETLSVPPVWKQTMLVLLVLYPVVMLEFKILNPHTSFLGVSLSTFIGNLASVSLVSWPLMPLAIFVFYWWLYGSEKKSISKELLGIFLIALLYLFEIIFFALF